MGSQSKTIGLFGSSIIAHYPLEMFKAHHIHPIIISTSPKNIASIIKFNSLEKAITLIQTQQYKLDYILILVGSNDIGKLTPTKIIQELIHIADTFSNINITPIIVPMMNREAPRYITTQEYRRDRNKINKKLKAHYKAQKLPRILKLRNLHLKDDGVHLTDSSYKVLSKAISFHIKQIDIKDHIFQFPPGHYRDLNNNEHYTVEHITENETTQ